MNDESKTHLPLDECEKGEIHGGILKIVNNDFSIGEKILEHILEQKKSNEQNGIGTETTLIVASHILLHTLTQSQNLHAEGQNLHAEGQNLHAEGQNLHAEGQNFTLTHYILNGRKAVNMENLRDIVLVYHDAFEKVKEGLKKMTWKRIILHDTLKGREERFKSVCQFSPDLSGNSTQFRWCLTEDPKQDYLAHFLKLGQFGDPIFWERFKKRNPGNPKEEEENCFDVIRELLVQAILRFPSNGKSSKIEENITEDSSSNKKEPQDSERSFDDPMQKHFMEKLKECEKQKYHGGTITVTLKKSRIVELIFAHILEKKQSNKNEGILVENTLMVGPPFWILDCEDLIMKDFQADLSTYFYGQKSNESLHAFATLDIVFASYNQLETVGELQETKWKRIVFLDERVIEENKKPLFLKLCQLQANYRWCLTNNPKQHYLAHVLKLERYGEQEHWNRFITSLEEKRDHLKNVDHLLEKANLRFLSYTDHIDLIEKAKQEKDSWQFSRTVWEAIFSFTEVFFLRKFDFRFDSGAKLENMYDILCEGLYGKDAVFIMKLWAEVHWNYEVGMRNQDNFLLPQDTMDDIVSRLEKSIQLIENSKTDLIERKIEYMKGPQALLTIHSFPVSIKNVGKVRHSL